MLKAYVFLIFLISAPLIALFYKEFLFRSRNKQGKCALCESELDQMKKRAIEGAFFYEIFYCKHCTLWSYVKQTAPYWLVVVISLLLLCLTIQTNRLL